MIAVTGYTPDDLLETATTLLMRPDAKAVGIWPRAAAHLCRQALEASLDELWRGRVPGMEEVSTRAQLICLATYLKDHELAGRIAYTWSALSAACHHRAYELSPSASELGGWIDTVASLRRHLEVTP